MKFAMMLAGMAAGKRAGGPAELLAQGQKLLTRSPELSRLSDEVRGRLIEAGKQAAVAVAARQVEALTDRVTQRAASLGDVVGGGQTQSDNGRDEPQASDATETEPETEPEGEPEPAADQASDETSEQASEEPEESGEPASEPAPTRRRSANSGSRGRASGAAGTARRAASPAARAAGKTASRATRTTRTRRSSDDG
jgi:hypothetical protein